MDKCQVGFIELASSIVLSTRLYVLGACLFVCVSPTQAQLETPPELPPISFNTDTPSVAATQTLKEVVQQAVLTQPGVLASWHAFLAAGHERDAAAGAYLPRVDLAAAGGKETRDDPLLQRSNYATNGSSLMLTQMIYDGFLTQNQVTSLSHARMSSLFALQDVSENTALDSIRAYLDVLRHRELLALVEDNYVQHRAMQEQIRLKVKAGVGRRVDLEQVTARLAQVESDLLAETSALHDASTQFQRLTGLYPALELQAPPQLNKDFPADLRTAQRIAQAHNPALWASIENVRAATSAQEAKTASYQPRLDFRLRNDRGNDLDGIPGTTNNKTAEFVLTWNLFNGFSDINTSRQFAELRNSTLDLRDKTCRDLRQTLAIAFNDARRLQDQLHFLEQNRISVEKALDAYRKQFDIGQRTLLDVLNTENELFQARLAYTNAYYDLQLAYARTHAGLGNLFNVLGLSRVDAEYAELTDKRSAEAAEYCPPEPQQKLVVDKKKLDERADRILRDLGVSPVSAAAPEGLLAGANAKTENIRRDVDKAMKNWLAAWRERRVDEYLACYSTTFATAEDSDHQTWEARRRKALSRQGEVRIDIGEVGIDLSDARRAITTFVQRYSAPHYSDVVRKTLVWELTGDRWVIVDEMASPERID